MPNPNLPNLPVDRRVLESPEEPEDPESCWNKFNRAGASKPSSVTP